jgi:glycosyltransferase involved in cell wall biosynthesis
MRSRRKHEDLYNTFTAYLYIRVTYWFTIILNMQQHELTNGKAALLVADSPGHIIDRIGRSWRRHCKTIEHELTNSGRVSSFAICRRARQIGVVHWLDQIAYNVLRRAVRAPQVAMVHHLTADCLEAGVAALDSADAITTTSTLWQQKLETLTGRPVVRIPYSLDTKLFQTRQDRDATRLAAGLGRRQFVVGFVGKAGANHANRKGVDVLEAILKNASSRPRNLSLVLVGPGWDSMARRIRQTGVDVLQRQYKTTEETVDAYSLMDALLITSSEEGGPCTLMEAMACGVPVVTSLVGHVREIIIDGETGFICPNRSPREYIDRLNTLALDADLRCRMASQAREFIVRERDDSVVIPRVDFPALYNGAIQRFKTRNCIERAIRALPSACLYARSLARPLFRLRSAA